jgi:hypothetical protein
MDSQRRTSPTRAIHTSSDQAPPDPSASCASTATPTSTCAAAAALTRANDSPAFTNGHTTRYWTPSRFPDPKSNSSGTAPCPVATSTPIQPSPLRPAPTEKWKPVQPPLPEEQTPEVQRWPQQPQQQHSPLRSTSPKPSVKSNSDPSLAHYSEGSLKEYFLKNINSDFCNEAPLLIEEKLKALFSNFISELSGTMDSFPGTLLESCVLRLSSTINSSVQKIITSEVIPVLFDLVFKHINEFPLPPNRNEQLQEFFNDKLDSLQDIIIGLNSENSSELSDIKNSMRNLEAETFSNMSAMRDQLAESAVKEEASSDQNKRRLSDFHSSMNAMNHKLDFLVNSLHKVDPPQVVYNNPFMHDWHPHTHSQRAINPTAKDSLQQSAPLPGNRAPPPPPTPPSSSHPERNDSPEPRKKPDVKDKRNDKPQWEKDFPFINHESVDPEMRKELWKSIPKTSDWEKFSGELPYNHELWLKNIDVFVEDYCMLDHMVISRLTALFTDTAKNWYIGIRDSHSKKSWAWWKHTIRNKFGTHNWKWKMQQEFENDYFTMDNKKVHKWFNNQRERLRAFQPELSEYLICEKVLKQCPGSLEHAVKSRYKKEAEQMSFEEMVIIIEEVLDRAMRHPRSLPSNSSNQHNGNNPFSTQVDPNKTEAEANKPSNVAEVTSRSIDTCNYCKQPGHYVRECPKRRQRINQVDMSNLDPSYLSDQASENNHNSPKIDSEETSNQRENDHFVLAMDQYREYEPSGPIDRDCFEY